LRPVDATPSDIGLDYEPVKVRTEDDIDISGWFIRSEQPRAAVIFCHGNGGNISHRLGKIKTLNDLRLDVLIFDYRGYGMSAGRPSENGLYLDAESMYNYLVNVRKQSPEKVIVFGESLGAAVAIDLAYRRDVAGVIVEGGFSSVRDMAKMVFPFVPAFVYASRYDSLEKIGYIRSPKLIFHSVNDEIIPVELGRKLFNAASEPKEFVEVRGGHNDTFFVSRDIFISKIDEFVRKMEEQQLLIVN
ncbi:MAG TPA: alpha/beta hydrolase, partial [Nitrospirae bacterium]|nr:alpha/beta hydrolase [Nitrospirota bacterium]